MPKGAFGDGHVHLGVPFHSTGDAFVGLHLGLFEKLTAKKPTEQNNQQSDHDRCADEFGQRELPAQERQHDDAEFDDEIGGGHFERHGRGEISALAEQRASNRYGRIRARRRRGPKSESRRNRTRPVVRQEPSHFPMGNNRLHNCGECEAKNQRPQDLPSHGERHAERP